MMKLRAFTIISLLMLAGRGLACWYPDPQSADNMIYRLVEDVSPYYMYSYNHSLLYVKDIKTENENLALWQKQLKKDVDDTTLRWFVYTSSLNEFMNKKDKAEALFGKDGYRLLCIAKECEDFRDYINDPWYYPCKNDKLVQSIESRLKEVKAYKGRYASRYALQAVRILVALQKYQDAVSYWEKHANSLPKDVVKDMAERLVARAYLLSGQVQKAANTYARIGDLCSLLECGLDKDTVWNTVYEQCPNSPFFIHELQYLLTHLDNHYIENFYENYGTLCSESEMQHIQSVIKLADRAIRERKVKDIVTMFAERKPKRGLKAS